MWKKLIPLFATIVIGLLAYFLIEKISKEEAGNLILAKKPVIGFILNGEFDENGWNGAHYQAMAFSAKELGVHVIYKRNVGESPVALGKAVADLAGKGATVIFTTSFGYSPLLVNVAARYPKIHFYCAAGIDQSENVNNYFGRMYQARFLAGLIAGSETRTRSIGYIAAIKICETVRGIDAFTLGVRMVNPKAKVYVYWTNSWNDAIKEKAGANLLIDRYKADILTYHQNTSNISKIARTRGIRSIGYNYDAQSVIGDSYLTAAIWHWDIFYEDIIRNAIAGHFVRTNYWEGIDKGIIGLSPISKDVDSSSLFLLDSLKIALAQGKTDVFYGPIKDNEGKLRVAKGENLSDDVLFNEIDWFVEGVQEVNP
ncbi:MAG: BMP family ABC transporter substrate-binding protein [Fibrobacteraceae bacterium]|nr:BMP family ABC transporter substrate-binding protein [Fibrobacteraceae bacterium]